MDATLWWPRRCSFPNSTWRIEPSEDVPVSTSESAVLVDAALVSVNGDETITLGVVTGYTEAGYALQHPAKIGQQATTIAACALKSDDKQAKRPNWQTPRSLH